MEQPTPMPPQGVFAVMHVERHWKASAISTQTPSPSKSLQGSPEWLDEVYSTGGGTWRARRALRIERSGVFPNIVMAPFLPLVAGKSHNAHSTAGDGSTFAETPKGLRAPHNTDPPAAAAPREETTPAPETGPAP
jgi:hypothetical protein